MNTNTLRRLNWLWKHRHTHDDDVALEQLTITIGEIQQQVSAGQGGSGAYIHLERTATQEIAVDGEPIGWDQLGLLGFAGFGPPPGIGDDGSAGGALTPSEEIVIPLTGYWDVKLDAGWVSFTDGGSVWITRTRGGVESTVYPPAGMPDGMWTATDGQVGEWIAKALPLQTGDILKVCIDADDGAAQDLASAVVSVELVDRARNRSYYRELVLSHGPVAYWRLDELSGTLCADETGTYDLTYSGGPTFGSAGVMSDGSGSPSVTFDGVDDSAVGSNWATLEFLGNLPFTVEAWFKTTTIASGYAIIVHQQNSSGGNGWELIRNGATVAFKRTPGAGSVGATIAANTTYHVVVSYDGSTLTMYLNGVMVSTISDTQSMAASTAALSIGYDSSGTPFYWAGGVDEVAIYDRALSNAEAAAHFQVGSQGGI